MTEIEVKIDDNVELLLMYLIFIGGGLAIIFLNYSSNPQFIGLLFGWILIFSIVGYLRKRFPYLALHGSFPINRPWLLKDDEAKSSSKIWIIISLAVVLYSAYLMFSK